MVALLIGWCFLILKPFISPVVWGIIMAVWLVLVILSDNVLKPILLGRGAPVPMPVIFLGAIGGFMSMGFLGLFVGGMLFGGLEKQRKHELLLAAEGTGDTLGLDHLGGIQEPHGLNLNI